MHPRLPACRPCLSKALGKCKSTGVQAHGDPHLQVGHEHHVARSVVLVPQRLEKDRAQHRARLGALVAVPAQARRSREHIKSAKLKNEETVYGCYATNGALPVSKGPAHPRRHKAPGRGTTCSQQLQPDNSGHDTAFSAPPQGSMSSQKQSKLYFVSQEACFWDLYTLLVCPY